MNLGVRSTSFCDVDTPGEWQFGATQVFALNKCGYITSGSWPVAEGGVASVSWNTQGAEVEGINPDWLQWANRENWRHWQARQR